VSLFFFARAHTKLGLKTERAADEGGPQKLFPWTGNWNMATIAREKKARQGNQWFDVEHLIAGLDAPAALKYLLSLVHLHTNRRKGYAWAAQTYLAHEMSVSLPTVERLFRKAAAMGVVGVRRVRTGKLPQDQHNEYWLIPDRMKQLQRAPVNPKDETEHPSSVRDDAA
jgi:hypothetical protein